MGGENLELVALLLAPLVFSILRYYVLERIADEGVGSLLTPLLRLPGVSLLVRWGVIRPDTLDSEGGTDGDTPADTPADTPDDTWDHEELGGGAVLIDRPRERFIRVPQMVDLSGGEQDPDGPPEQVRADPATVVAWVRRQRAAGWNRAEILAEGQELYGCSESTMVRRYRDATQGGGQS
jgi:hypothetical protein